MDHAKSEDYENVTDEEWKQKLSPSLYQILRQKATERAFTGKYLDNKEKGIYQCAGCGTELFQSDTKFDSGSGWPSFFQPINSENVATEIDQAHGMTREEIVCKKCGGHLGHLFNDGPPQSGLRYCVNGASLEFKKVD